MEVTVLKSVRIEQFKSITDATLELGPVTVIIGPNNAGKSSVLQATQFAVSIAQSLRIDGTGRWLSGSLGGTLSAQQLMYSPLQDVYALAHGGTLRQRGNDIRVSFTTDDLGDCAITVRRGRNKNISISATGRALVDRIEDVNHPYSVFAPGLAGIPAFEEFRAEGTVTRAAARGDANSVFRNVLWRLKQDAAAWNEFEKSLAEMFPHITVEVDFDERVGEYIDARVTSGSFTVPIDAAGTGVLQAIQVLAYIGLYKPRLLILDEPDSHLHPDNQRKLARLLTALTRGGDLQVLMSTHSRHFLDEFGALGANIVWFSSGETRPIVGNQVDVLLELGALDAGDRLRNGTTPVVVITEDADRKYLDALMLSSGFESSDYDVWSYNGSTKLDSALVLVQFIGAHAPGTKIIVHRDSDFAPTSELDAYRASIKAAGASVLTTEGTDIESFFLRPAHLEHVFLELPAADLASALAEATSATKDVSIKLLTDDRFARAQRARSTGGPTPSAGDASQQANAEYAADPQRYRHGKKTLGALHAVLQRDHSLNKPVTVQSAALEVLELRVIADEIHAL